MAKWPYNTGAWQRLRLAKLSDCPICFVCEMRGRIEQANTVDHITPISQGGHPFPSLDQLMALCQRCHNEKTSGFDRTAGNPTGRRFKGCDASGNPVDPADGWNTGTTDPIPALSSRAKISIPFRLRSSRIPVTIVCGPPASGKSTYVRDHASASDVVIDFDQCLVAAGGSYWGWDCAPEIRKKAYRIRDGLLRSLSRRKLGKAWFIVSAPSPIDRAQWKQALRRASIVVLTTDAATCIDRIRSEPLRASRADQQCDAVRKWWRVYEPGAGEITGDTQAPDRAVPTVDT